jgi:rhamnogalacturonan endolyase
MHKTGLFILTLMLMQYTLAAQQQSDTVMKGVDLKYSDVFAKPIDSTRWIIEMAPTPNSSVYTKDSLLVLDTKGGVTVWFNHPLPKNVRIEFDRKIIVASGVNDRLSDCNVFWMATDPHNKNLFTRNGVLESYDSLQLYYVGMGGNTNRTTRFRKYEGNGQRTLLQEYTDSMHLLQPNQVYHFLIVVFNGTVSFWVNYQRFFTYKDAAPLQGGYFGFRSTKSHQEISNFKVYELQ